jgi:integrase
VPRARGEARVVKRWIASRGKWRVIAILADGRRTAVHFDDEAAADKQKDAFERELRRLGEVTVEKAIVAYRRERLSRRDIEARSVDDDDYKIRRLLAPVLALRMSGISQKRAQELYEGRYEGVHLVEHGLVNRPKLRRAPSEDKNPCLLACKCLGDGPPLAVDAHRQMLLVTKTFMRWCASKGWVTASPFEGVKGQGRRNAGGLGKSSLSKTELRALFTTAMDVARAGDERAVGVLFALVFGMRATEIVTRRCRDIDVVTWTVEIDPEHAKTDASDRDNEIPPALRPVVQMMMKGKRPDQWLFGDGDSPHWRDWVSESTRRLCVKAKIRTEHAHALRGAHEDLAKAAGVNARAIMEQLGHRDEKVGERSYTSAKGRRAARKAKQSRVLSVLEGGKAAGGRG